MATIRQIDDHQNLASIHNVTLDGRPAKISGIYNDEALIWQTDRSYSIKLPWSEVRRVIVEQGDGFSAAFTS